MELGVGRRGAFATLIWLAASVGFSIYSANFGRYNETYDALGAVVVMMLWLYISAYVTVAGAELNAELERQTARDTTTGRPEVMGRRDAYAADTPRRVTPVVGGAEPGSPCLIGEAHA